MCLFTIPTDLVTLWGSRSFVLSHELELAVRLVTYYIIPMNLRAGEPVGGLFDDDARIPTDVCYLFCSELLTHQSTQTNRIE